MVAVTGPGAVAARSSGRPERGVVPVSIETPRTSRADWSVVRSLVGGAGCLDIGCESPGNPMCGKRIAFLPIEWIHYTQSASSDQAFASLIQQYNSISSEPRRVRQDSKPPTTADGTGH